MKKGQATAINATYLIAIIAVLILAYILLLPESEKEKFANAPDQLGQPSVRNPVISSGFKMLLSESPGIIYPFTQQGISKPLASVNLFSEIESKIDSIANSISVSSGLFGSDEKEVTFRLDDIKNIASANLLFFVSEKKSNLIIKLNGIEIFNDVPSSENLPVPLPRAQLRQVNKLQFSVEKPSLLGSNKYALKNLQVNTKIKNENNREVRTFVLSKAERNSLQGLSLFYVVNCFTVSENSRLIVRFNNRVISDGLVVCDAAEVSVDLSPTDILEGRNTLEFEIDRGKYVLERVLIEGQASQQTVPNYIFTLQLQDLDILDSGAHVYLEMQFRNDRLRKIGTMYINGAPVYIDTFGDKFDFDITDFIAEGRNVLRIVPNVPFEVANMNVVLG